MTILPMYRKCRRCKKYYAQNPDCGGMYWLCPKCSLGTDSVEGAVKRIIDRIKTKT